LVEQNPGVIPGKGAAGGVRAVGARRKTDNQQSRLRRSKRRNRAIVIVRVRLPHPGEMCRKPGAAGAGRVELQILVSL
jgi:hypothetical protein